MLAGFRSGYRALPGLRIQFDEADVTEVRAVGEPERPVGRIAKHAWVDRVAVLDAVGPDDRTAVLPFVVRRIRIECPSDEQPDGGLGLGAGGGIVDEVLVAGPNHVRRPRVVTAAREHIWSGSSAWQRLHHRPDSPPGPAIVGDGDRQTVAGRVDIEPAVVGDDGRRVVQARLPVERRQRRRKEHRGSGTQPVLHLSTPGMDVPTDPGICSSSVQPAGSEIVSMNRAMSRMFEPVSPRATR